LIAGAAGSRWALLGAGEGSHRSWAVGAGWSRRGSRSRGSGRGCLLATVGHRLYAWARSERQRSRLMRRRSRRHPGEVPQPRRGWCGLPRR
jgi:hypothetical protein